MSNFSLGPCGCCGGKDADIQVIIALLRRVGLGPWSTVSALSQAPGAPLPTLPLPAQLNPLSWPYPLGPLNPYYSSPNAGNIYIPAIQWIEPLYLACTTTMAWYGGPAYTTKVVLDPVYADFTVVSSAPNIPSQVNVPAGKTSANPTWEIIDSFVTLNDQPPLPWPPNTAYGPAPDANPVGSISPDGLTFTLSFPNENYDNGDGTFTNYIGGTLTWQLDPTTKKMLADYATLCSGFLDEATLQDGTLAPNKTYPIAGLTDPATNLPAQAFFRYFCEFPKTGNPWLYTNTLILTRARTGNAYSGDGKDLAPGYNLDINWGDWSGASLTYGTGQPAVSLPCNAITGLNPTSSLPLSVVKARFPLAANGMVFGAGGLPGAPATMSAPYIFSAQSSVRSQSALGDTIAVTYTPANEQLTAKLVADPGIGEHILGPANVGGVGFLWGLYSIETTCTTMTAQLPGPTPVANLPLMPQGGTPVFLGRNQKQTFYSCTFDSRGNWMRNRAGAWSLIPGGAGIGAITESCLVPAPDGLSAVFTAPNARGEAILVVTIAGLTYQTGIVVVVN